MPKIDFSTSKTCIGMHRSSECEKYTAFPIFLNHCVAKSCDTLRKKLCFPIFCTFKVVPKDRFSSNFYSTFTDLLGTDVEKCKKFYRRCFLQSLIKNHGWDPKQGKNIARICSPA